MYNNKKIKQCSNLKKSLKKFKSNTNFFKVNKNIQIKILMWKKFITIIHLTLKIINKKNTLQLIVYTKILQNSNLKRAKFLKNKRNKLRIENKELDKKN